MQNKARLELADYEAVGTLLLEFNAGGVGRSFPANLMFPFCALGSSVTVSFVSCQNCGKAGPEATSGHNWGMSLALQHLKASAVQPALQDWGKLHRSLHWFPVPS